MIKEYCKGCEMCLNRLCGGTSDDSCSYDCIGHYARSCYDDDYFDGCDYGDYCCY